MVYNYIISAVLIIYYNIDVIIIILIGLQLLSSEYTHAVVLFTRRRTHGMYACVLILLLLEVPCIKNDENASWTAPYNPIPSLFDITVLPKNFV